MRLIALIKNNQLKKFDSLESITTFPLRFEFNLE